MEDTTMVIRKLVFFSKKQTNERNEKERKVLWEEKEMMNEKEDQK